MTYAQDPMTHSQKPIDHPLPPGPHRPGLSRRQAKFLRKGLRRLGHRTYDDYLASPHWQGLRVRYAGSRRPKRCAVCHDPAYELHHRTYRRLGEERLDDLLALCGRHHGVLHEAALSLWDGHRALLRVRESDRELAVVSGSPPARSRGTVDPWLDLERLGTSGDL